jgi:hypothetical protein
VTHQSEPNSESRKLFEKEIQWGSWRGEGKKMHGSSIRSSPSLLCISA